MTKQRQPLSEEEALHEVYGALGMDAVRRITGKSDSLCRAWADPDMDGHRLPFRQALLLDAGCIRGGHGRAPLLTLHRATVDREMAVIHDPRSPTAHLFDLTERLGDVAGELRAALCTKGDGGVTITEREALRILVEVEELAISLAALKRDLVAVSVGGRRLGMEG